VGILVDTSANAGNLCPATENGTSVNESSPQGIKAQRRTGDKTEPVHGGADYWGVEARRNGDEDDIDLPTARDQPRDVLQMEGEVRGLRGERGAAGKRRIGG
jgi:hypothetical protein